MTSLNKVHVNKKAYRCWYKLNKKTVFRVATPAGVTEASEATDIISYFLPVKQKKSRIWETPTLSTDADSRTDTILERLRDF